MSVVLGVAPVVGIIINNSKKEKKKKKRHKRNNMQIFVGTALKVCQELQITGKSQGIVMKFAKQYEPAKMARITQVAKTYPWAYKNPVAAFMKAVGEVNKQEKLNNG